ncbi:hypothetical protein [Vibrio vulnificus]|uniref:hypothetical protein n=1 Tax=Vibrio vulnificus TaxID=672 RepID=UPI000B339D42|nr:hypothetical protein [Vibrio vulnificus]
MNIDKIKGAIVASLLLLFFWAGQETNATNTTLWEIMKGLITTLCSVGTLAVAALALDNWKMQAKNAVIDKIVESLSSVQKAQRAFCYSLSAIDIYNRYNDESWKDHVGLYEKRYENLSSQIAQHKTKLQLLKRYSDDGFYRELTNLFSKFETDVYFAHEYIKSDYPSVVKEPYAMYTFNGLSLEDQQKSLESSFESYASFLDSIQ